MKKGFTFLCLFGAICLFSLSGYTQQILQMPQDYPILIGSTEIHNIYSQALSGNLQGNPSTQAVKIYLPPGYDAYPNNSYPVVHLLHAYTGNYDSYYRLNDFYTLLNRMISKKIISPMIIVTPNGSTKYDGSMFSNSYVSGNWEDFIAEDVVQYVENKYRTLNHESSRGISGFSMGGYGSAIIGMKHPSIFGSVAPVGAAALDLQTSGTGESGLTVENLTAAAGINEYKADDAWDIRVCFASAVAWSPDSTAEPILGRLPYDAEGNRIDSIWAKWLLHDPISLIPAYKDSLLKLDTLHYFIGSRDDVLPANNSFHQALLDQGIEHGYEVYSAGHDPEPVLDEMLMLFSESLISAIPFIRLFGSSCLEHSDTLVAASDRVGKIYIVPDSTDRTIDSIYNYQLAAYDVLAQEKTKIPLSEFVNGKYLVFAVSDEGMISNVPEIFWVVEHNPIITLQISNYDTGDLISACEVSVEGNTFVTDGTGHISFKGCGALDSYRVKINQQNYGPLDLTFQISSDTTISMTLVEDFYLKVLDRKTKEPVYRASIGFGDNMSFTNFKGLLTIQNLRSEKFSYRIEHREYFTEEDSVDRQSVDTLVVELTKLMAIIEIQVSDDEGFVADQPIMLDGSEVKTDEDGMGYFYFKPARQTYQYSIERPCFFPVFDSLYLEIDTLISIQLEADTIPPWIDIITTGDSIQISSSASGNLYVVRAGTKRQIDSILANPFLIHPISTDDPIVVNTSGLPDSGYWIYLVDNCQKISEEIITGEEEITAHTIRMYPNPVTHELFIETHADDKYTLDITNINGQRIINLSFTGTTQHIDLSALGKGVYFITIRSNEFVCTRKIIKY